MKTTSGFTAIEALTLFIAISVLAAISLGQYQTLQSIHRDQDRKVAINAMYYNLKEVVKPKLGGYPRTLKAADLRAMDPALRKDPNGVAIGNARSDYRYEPTGCNGGDICKDFTLRSTLERETDFVRSSL